MLRPSGKIFRHARVVGVVFRPQVVDPQDGLVVADLRDRDVAVGGRSTGARNEQPVVPEPVEVDREVSVGDRAQHRDPLPEPQVLADAELVDGRRH